MEDRSRKVSTDTGLFTPLTIRGSNFRNRIAVSPMCEYSSQDGFANDWHVIHLGSRAVGGAGLVLTEAAAVEPRGRISPGDLGIWKDEHIEKLAQITAFIKQQGAVPGMQIAHAGRKASCRVPWEGGAAIPPGEGGWQTVAPSAVPFRESDHIPAELSVAEIHKIVEAFGAATRRALAAGFEVIEIHAAHGIFSTNFIRRCPTDEPTNTAARSRTGSGLPSMSRRRFAQSYPITTRSLSVSLQPIGKRVVGHSTIR